MMREVRLAVCACADCWTVGYAMQAWQSVFESSLKETKTKLCGVPLGDATPSSLRHERNHLGDSTETEKMAQRWSVENNEDPKMRNRI